MRLSRRKLRPFVRLDLRPSREPVHLDIPTAKDEDRPAPPLAVRALEVTLLYELGRRAIDGVEADSVGLCDRLAADEGLDASAGEPAPAPVVVLRRPRQTAERLPSDNRDALQLRVRERTGAALLGPRC